MPDDQNPKPLAPGTKWEEYFQATQDRPPHKTLTIALDAFDREPKSAGQKLGYDIGCGAGRESLLMLHRGWHVIALDRDQNGLSKLASKAESLDSSLQEKLECRLSDMSTLSIPPASALLVNASFSLPFCPSEAFDSVWEQIVLGIKPGGRFSGHFFGLNDTWANRPDMTCKSKPAVLAMLRDFELETFEEKEGDGVTAVGDPKYWHVFSVVARKQK
jgi:tellurite methyltransferase